jgi:2-polyprenyl-3-methyl-5-hydroxy-6-metoxy-1,4-benzoquinol methylase
MPEDIRTCPLCKYDRSKLFDTREFRGESVVNRLCLNCGLVFQSPRMTTREADAFYAREYRMLYEGSIEPTPNNLQDQLGRAVSLYGFVHPFIDKITRHLDIGCSFGVLLNRFQEGYHCQAFGIEPGDGHRAHAQKTGLNVHATLEAFEQENETPVDCISMAHVVEHLPDPVGYLSHLKESLLTPDGWLVIEVPNLYAHDSFEIAHLVSYSSHTLVQTLKKAGFEIIKLEQHGRPRSGLFPLYITVLARPRSNSQPAEWSPIPEKRVFLKRKTGMLKRRILERLFPSKAWLPKKEIIST